MSHQPSPFLFGSPAVQPGAAMLAMTLVGVIVAVALLFYCITYSLEDLNRHQIVAGGNKQTWAIIIILGGPFGQAAYWLYGRGPY